MARKKFDVFNLSFLDVMACGLGAIVLFYMIINAQVAARTDLANEELLAETSLLELEVFDGTKDLIRIRTNLEEERERKASAANEAEALQRTLERLLEDIDQVDKAGLAQTDSIEKLKSDIDRLKQAKQKMQAETADPGEQSGRRLRSYIGEGNRQYLTGMKMGGKRVLILVDSSASMLGRSYVNVVRFRLMDDERKRQTPKWQQTVDTVDWLTTKLEPGTHFQVYRFNEEVASVVPDSTGEWLKVLDGSGVDRAIEGLRAVTPGKGSNLYRAFRAIREMEPLPDNVFLLTDGLPTQGSVVPAKPEMVKPRRRVDLFNKAVRELPGRVPLNVILFPMDGDPDAAAFYWRLAVERQGSFMAPSRDWP
jgi:hypothetical protein